MRTFRVVSHALLYNGMWLVLREDDLRLMHAAQTPMGALKWVRTWGDTLGQQRGGQEASHRLLSSLGLLPIEPEPEPPPFNDDF